MDLLREATLFIAIREAGSLRGAAQRMSLSNAAVSRRLSALERELGASLFLRTTRQLRVTEAGERFHEHALRLLATARTMLESVRPSGSLRGSLVVSTSVTYGLLRAGPVVQRVLATHPELEIELRLEDRLSDLMDDGVDIAIRAGAFRAGSESLIGRTIQTLERCLVASPAYLRRAKAPRRPEQLVEHSLLGGAGLSAASTLHLEYEGSAHAVTLPRRFHTRNLLAIRDAAVGGLGIAVLPKFVVAPLLEARTLTRVLPRATLPSAEVIALYRVERRGDPAVRAVVDALLADASR